MFDLSESDAVFKEQGEEEYRKYQEAHLRDPLPRGPAFSFVRRLLSLNDLAVGTPASPLVEVILLSRNDPDTGLRVMQSMQHYQLDVTRAVFTQGRTPYEFIAPLHIALFLSGDAAGVREAVEKGHPAGHVMASEAVDDPADTGLRIAFDFDGVLASDESERVYQAGDITAFHGYEQAQAGTHHQPGPLKEFLVRISRIQRLEEERRRNDASYQIRLRVSIVTARNAPSHERAVQTLKSWGVMVNDAVFLGGVEKGPVLGVLKPHIYFDDQVGHIQSAARYVRSVHVPYGISNVVAPASSKDVSDVASPMSPVKRSALRKTAGKAATKKSPATKNRSVAAGAKRPSRKG
ncbi:MAG: 5'-nucleotidase [Gemmatimonadaceae bacterium]|nr:5'-nucleotidase [Gemmatimonadaceae bacterium]